jgi:uncharacterized protein
LNILDHIPIVKAGKNGWNLADKAYSTFSEKYKRKQRWKALYYTMLYPKFANKWFSLLQDEPYQSILKSRPQMFIKPFRVYISTKWPKQQKVKVLKDSYRFIIERKGLLKQILFENKKIPLAKFTLKDSAPFTVSLYYDIRYRKEGELVIGLITEDVEDPVVAMSFSFENADGEWWARIGCVQGHRKEETYASKNTQKQMHGMRPKALIVFAFQEMCKGLGIKKIYAVSDKIQSYRKKHFIHLPGRHNIGFNYDTLWEEVGGTFEKNGWVELPMDTPRKTSEEIPSRKRAMYKRRYQFLDDLAEDIKVNAEKL